MPVSLCSLMGGSKGSGEHGDSEARKGERWERGGGGGREEEEGWMGGGME